MSFPARPVYPCKACLSPKGVPPPKACLSQTYESSPRTLQICSVRPCLWLPHSQGRGVQSTVWLSPTNYGCIKGQQCEGRNVPCCFPSPNLSNPVKTDSRDNRPGLAATEPSPAYILDSFFIISIVELLRMVPKSGFHTLCMSCLVF